jgi:hypothetical protein
LTLAHDDTRASIPIVLRWKPAQIVVSCGDAPNAAVIVKKGAVSKHGSPGAAIAMPVPPDATKDGEFTVVIMCSAAGYRPGDTTRGVRAGETARVTLPLRKAE